LAVSGRLASEWSPIPYRLALARRKFKALDKNKRALPVRRLHRKRPSFVAGF
jgi:hypothetical protein